MFKKLLKAVLPALLVFSFANVNNVKVEAVNKKINVRVDYLEEGTNKELAESFNKGLAAIKANGEYQKIYDKWMTR